MYLYSNCGIYISKIKIVKDNKASIALHLSLGAFFVESDDVYNHYSLDLLSLR